MLLDTVIKPLESLNQFNASKVIQWAPPSSNWNPWLAVRISNPVSAANSTDLLVFLKNFDEHQKYFIITF